MASKQDYEDNTCEEVTSIGWVHASTSAKDDPVDKADTTICTKFKPCAKGGNGIDESNIQQGLTKGRNVHSQELSHTLEKEQKTSSVNEKLLVHDTNQKRIFGHGDQAFAFQKPYKEEVITYDREGHRVVVQKTYFKLENNGFLFGSNQQGEIKGKEMPTMRNKENESEYPKASEVQGRVIATNHHLETVLQPQASVAHGYGFNLSTKANSSKNTEGPISKNDTKKENPGDVHLSHNHVEAGKKIIQSGAQLNNVTRDAVSVKIASEVGNICKMPLFANEDHQKQSNNLKGHKNQSLQHSESSVKVKSEYIPQEGGKSNKTKSTGEKQDHRVKRNYKYPEDKVIRSHILQPVKSFSCSSGMYRKYYGSARSDGKVMILVGASGSGKTTLVDFIANYFKDVETVDNEVFQITSSGYSSTTSITAYTFSFSEAESPITIIDTPGLSDSSEKGRENHIQSVKTFLANTYSEDFKIHAIGFVARAHQTHLSSSERLFIDYVSTLFGQVAAKHFITFITFVADTNEVQPVVTAIKDCGMKCNVFVNFNNSILSSSGVEKINDFDRIYWKIGRKSWKKCLKFIQELPPLSVNTLKTSQNKAYETTVSESAVRNLREEIKKFIDFCKKSQHLCEEAVQCQERVWGCASVLHHLQSRKDSKVKDVTSIVTGITEEICKQNGFTSKDCIEKLCLMTSKGLLASGIGIILGLGPLYECAKTYSKLQKEPEKNLLKTMYCSSCKEDHNMQRESSGYTGYISNLELGDILISFKCQNCNCGAATHYNKPYIPAYQLTWNLAPDELLRLANENISQMLKLNSPHGYVISRDQFLHHVNSATNFKYQALVQDLLKA